MGVSNEEQTLSALLDLVSASSADACRDLVAWHPQLLTKGAAALLDVMIAGMRSDPATEPLAHQAEQRAELLRRWRTIGGDIALREAEQHRRFLPPDLQALLAAALVGPSSEPGSAVAVAAALAHPALNGPDLPWPQR